MDRCACLSANACTWFSKMGQFSCILTCDSCTHKQSINHTQCVQLKENSYTKVVHRERHRHWRMMLDCLPSMCSVHTHTMHVYYTCHSDLIVLELLCGIFAQQRSLQRKMCDELLHIWQIWSHRFHFSSILFHFISCNGIALFKSSQFQSAKPCASLFLFSFSSSKNNKSQQHNHVAGKIRWFFLHFFCFMMRCRERLCGIFTIAQIWTVCEILGAWILHFLLGYIFGKWLRRWERKEMEETTMIEFEHHLSTRSHKQRKKAARVCVCICWKWTRIDRHINVVRHRRHKA